MYRVLVVDDNSGNLDLASRMLRKAGYGVATAASGEEGVRKADAWRYDLIVMDMAMPGINGGDATRLIRAAESQSGIRRVPVIAFTANTPKDFRQRAIRSDMDDFITKPIERRQLLAAVERSLDDRIVVLVADDNAVDRDRTSRFLRGLERVRVVIANSGDEAVAACLRQRITLALINLNLPGISGIETSCRIRTSKEGVEVALVAISDQVDPEARKHAAQSGFGGYLEKPFGAAELLPLMQTLTSRILLAPASV